MSRRHTTPSWTAAATPIDSRNVSDYGNIEPVGLNSPLFEVHPRGWRAALCAETDLVQTLPCHLQSRSLGFLVVASRLLFSDNVPTVTEAALISLSHLQAMSYDDDFTGAFVDLELVSASSIHC